MMIPEKNVSDGWQCAQVLNRFFYYLDEFRYEELAGLMLEDGTWFRQGQLLKGRRQVLDTLNDRSRTQRIRHVITNTIIDIVDETKAIGTAYMTVYKYDDGAELKHSPTIDGPFRVSLVQVRFAKVADEWRIADQLAGAQFEFSNREASHTVSAFESETGAKTMK